MTQTVSAVLGLVLAYFLPGVAASLAMFPSKEELPILERIAMSVGLSSSMVAFSLLASNWVFGRFNIPFVIALQFILVVASLAISRWLRPSQSVSWESTKTHEDAGNLLPKAIIWLSVLSAAFIVFFRFYNGIIFPITNWDSLTEFAYLGRLYYTEGRMPLIEGATLGIGSSANYPPLVPLLYTWFYMMSGGVNEVFARAVSPIFSLMTAVMTYYLARTMYGSRTLAKSSVFFLVTVPVFILVSEECLSDIVVTFFQLTSMYFLYRGFQDERDRSWKHVFAGGLFAGMAAFTKYIGLVTLIIGWVLILSLKITRSDSLRLRLHAFRLDDVRPLLIFLVGFLVLGAPWYVRNLVILNNPVYPLLYQVFGGRGIDDWVMKNSWDAHFSLVAAQNGFDFSPLSLISTYFTVFFKISPYEVLDLGPFLGAFFAIGIVFASKKRGTADLFLIVWSISYLAMWRFAFGTFLRYLSLILPALAIVSARGLASLYEAIETEPERNGVHGSFPRVPHQMWLRIIVFLVLFEGFLLPCAINGVRGYKTWILAGPFTTGQDYLRTRFQGTWEIVEFLNKTPRNTTVLTLDHSLAYYVDRTFVFLDEPRVKGLHQAASGAEVSALLSSLKVSFILTDTARDGFFPLLKTSYFYQHLDDGNYAQLLLEQFPSRIYYAMY